MSWGIEGTKAQVSVGAQPGTLPLGLSEELLGFLKMKGMLEQPLQGGMSTASMLGWCQVPGPISRVSPKLRLPSAAARMGEMRTGGLGACVDFQTQG